MKFTDETRRANCQACLLASCMKDCRHCQFYGSWSPTVYFVIMDDLHGPFPQELDPYKLELNF